MNEARPKTHKGKTMSLLRTLSFVSFCAVVSLFCQSQLLAQSSSPVFVKVNPAGTYLLVDSCDQAAPPTSVTLSSLGIVPGEFIRLTRAGAFKAGVNFNDDQPTLGAVFRGPSGLIAPGPNSQHASFNSLPTACNNISTNIAEDFNVAPQTAVQVPVAATDILFTGNDSFWSDNTDPNNDYGVSIEFGLSWAIVVTTTADSGAGSLRAAITAANTDGAPTTISFDPTVFPPPPPTTPPTPCAAPFLDQANVGAVTAGTAINRSEFAAQVITAAKSGILASVDFAIRKFDGVTFGDITVQIRGVTSGAPNSTILGSKTFANSSIAPLPAEFTTFDLSSLNLFLRAGDVFSVVVVSANQSGSPFPIALTDNLYAGGDLFSSTNGTNWVSFGRDTRFRTLVTITTPAPGTITLTSPLPNITGPLDSIDGSGVCVVLDGTNLPTAAGLRVRERDVTIHELTFINFSGNDAIVVEGTDTRPVVTDVTVSGNSFFNNFRGVRIDGGVQNTDTTVTASVLDNFFQENTRGIFVRGNGTSADGLTGNGGNTVGAVIDGNLVQGKTINPDDAGSGIIIQGGSGPLPSGLGPFGSDNIVTTIVTNNTVTQVRNDGIVANGCTANARGSNNEVNVTITGNNVKFNQSLPPSDLNNSGIIITGASGETAQTSFCSGNKITFLVFDNNVNDFKSNNIQVNGGDEGTHNNIVQGSVLANRVSNAGGRGIQVTGGQGNNHSVDVLLSDNISDRNGVEGIRVTAGTGINNIVSVGGIINNTASRNTGDGIAVRSNVPGINGGTLVSGNRMDRNGEDGIDINSTGYVLSNNTASRNAAAGIDAVGNVNGGGNKATQNASCNTPGCF
ncbi:MAG TPA: right-handed parallel beta-helix repeat-containing protein [Candidatus Binatia bacterium]|nr:right-handed parallel beta-helix repeat-containing protein [Candidatus Binatia bacterium]